MGILTEGAQRGTLVVTLTIAGEESSTVVQVDNQVVDDVAVATAILGAEDGLYFGSKIQSALGLLEMARLCEAEARLYREQYENLMLEGNLKVVEDLVEAGFYDAEPENPSVAKTA